MGQRPDPSPNLQDSIPPVYLPRFQDLSQDVSVNEEALAQAFLGPKSMGGEEPTSLCQDRSHGQRGQSPTPPSRAMRK